jgi:predicted dehydrogenase
MKKKLRVGIAGYGVVGKRRRFYIDLHPLLQTIAVCDKIFESDGVFDDGTLFFSQYQDLLSQELDVLFVCLSNDVAAEVTMAGLEKGIHVFCEKPPGRDLSDIAHVIDCERRYPHLKLKYGFNHRYHESTKDALSIVKSGELGDVINLRGVYGKSKFIAFSQDSDWRTDRAIAGGGILLDQGIHMVDLMRLFAGNFPTVHSFVSNNFWNHDVEDNAYALMRTDDGKVAMLHSSATQWRHRFQLDIMLTKGAIILSGILSGSKSYGAETMTVIWAGQNEHGDPREQMTRYVEDPSWADEIDEFATTIIHDKKITNGSSAEALETMKLVYRIYCADDEWRKKWNLSDKLPDTDIF